MDGRPVLYGEAGEGVPVVFVHGWALGQHAYKRALKRLVHLGCRVVAPALPGFGGSADLPARLVSFPGYAQWLVRFFDSVGLDGPVFLVGHSLGGGVAIQTAHDFPDRVRYLVLVNSVGGPAWSARGATTRLLAERPLWDWGRHFPADLLVPQMAKVLPPILEDALPNLLRNPLGLWRVANLARRADLTAQLEELKRRELPVVVLWGDKDHIIPRASFDALCTAIGSQGEVVKGNHSWLIADPDGFGKVMTNALEVVRAAAEADPSQAPDRQAARSSSRRRKLGASDAQVPPPAGDTAGVEVGQQR